MVFAIETQPYTGTKNRTLSPIIATLSGNGQPGSYDGQFIASARVIKAAGTNGQPEVCGGIPAVSGAVNRNATEVIFNFNNVRLQQTGRLYLEITAYEMTQSGATEEEVVFSDIIEIR